MIGGECGRRLTVRRQGRCRAAPPCLERFWPRRVGTAASRSSVLAWAILIPWKYNTKRKSPSMLNRNQFLLLTVLAALSLCLMLANMILYGGNRTVQTQVTARAQYIQQSLQLQTVYNALLRNLAQLSIKNNDAEIRDLLASHGITFNAKDKSGQSTQDKGNAGHKKGGGK